MSALSKLGFYLGGSTGVESGEYRLFLAAFDKAAALDCVGIVGSDDAHERLYRVCCRYGGFDLCTHGRVIPADGGAGGMRVIGESCESGAVDGVGRDEGGCVSISSGENDESCDAGVEHWGSVEHVASYDAVVGSDAHEIGGSVGNPDRVDGGDKKLSGGGTAGDDGGPKSLRGPNWSRNNGRRQKRKARKAFLSTDWRARQDCKVGEAVVSGGELRASLEAKWRSENALAVVKADREKAVIEASDINIEVRKRRVQNDVVVERGMVSIEKAHSSLRASGNVAGEFPGYVETIVSGPGLSLGSGTISPNSSISEAEVRKLQKDNVDMAKDLDDARRILKRFGLDKAKAEDYEKSLWTMNEDCQLPVDSFEKLESMYPDGYVYDPSYGDRARVTPVFD